MLLNTEQSYLMHKVRQERNMKTVCITGVQWTECVHQAEWTFSCQARRM